MKKVLKLFLIAGYLFIFLFNFFPAQAKEDSDIIILQSEPSINRKNQYKIAPPKSSSREDENSILNESGDSEYKEIMQIINTVTAPFVNMSNFEKRY